MSIQLTDPPPAPTPADASPGAGRADRWASLRPLVLRVHFYAGVLIGPFLLIAALTGLLYTATPQIEQTAYHELTHVTPGSSTTSLGKQVEAARASHPSGDIVEVDPPSGADRSTRVVFSDTTVPAGYAMSVFVDPYDGQVVGRVRSMGQWLGIRAWIDDLHRNLHLGAVGRNYSELAASWLWVVVLGGLALWLTRRRRDARKRRLILPDLAARGRARTRSWHGAIGLVIAVGLLGLSVSGLTWSRYTGAKISDLRGDLSWTTPSATTTLPHAGSTGSAASDDAGDMNGMAGMAGMAGDTSASTGDALVTAGIGIDGVLRKARAAGLGDPLVLTPPASADSAWTAGENKRSWPTHYDTIAVDASTGAIVDRVDFADWPLMAKVADWIIGAHMGILFGIPNQLALAALALGLIVVILGGYRMWWQRRPRGASGLRLGTPPARRAWRRIPAPMLAVLICATVFIGWLMPLLGISLVAFLVFDVVVQQASGPRRRTSSTA